jgi:hypothetical protein
MVFLQPQMLCTDVGKVENLDDPEEELSAEDSQITDCLSGQSFKQTLTAICLISLKFAT